ncbi:hypothetical protein [Bradyrhizobium sp. STM 3557]|uniref:hypothetical protein n=1 Tax=Bradyrhizobium sp. STM 3557 TaxID=578920 RepID=UPI00388DBDFE
MAIDDLIPGGISTVTLTLAFTRGVNHALSDQLGKRLIFLNGDFLLSDGSLASIADRFDAGQELLLCSSVRVREELVAEAFLRMRREDGVMMLPGRQAVSIALGALHPTVLACRVDQPLLHSAHPNQFFWKPDDASLVLRAFLLFPLAVVATRPPGPADTYCDFGWITTMVEQPSISIIDNTDELFIVELAPTGQEIDFVKAGEAVVADCAERMSSWMTEFSAAQGATPIIFRAKDGSEAAIAQAVRASDRFVDELRRNFGALHPVQNHPYWQAGVASYLRNRRDQGNDDVPPEIAPQAAQSTPKVVLTARIRDKAKRFVMGAPGRRHLWHPYYRPERLIERLGPLQPIGQVALLDQLGAQKSTRGSPIAMAEFSNWKTAERTVRRLWEAAAPNETAHLIVVNEQYLNPFEISIRERIAALAIIEQRFQIVSASSLLTRVEAAGLASNRRLAVELNPSRPLQASGMILASVIRLSQVLVANLSDRKRRDLADQSGILLLELKRRGDGTWIGDGEAVVRGSTAEICASSDT